MDAHRAGCSVQRRACRSLLLHAKGYVDAFFANLRFDEVDRRLGAATGRGGGGNG